MSTKTTKVAKTPAAKVTPKAAAITAPKASPAITPTPVIRLKAKDSKYEGARAAWYAALLAHEGKPAAVFIADCKATPPALTKAGKAEDPNGWLRYFVRIGAASLEG